MTPTSPHLDFKLRVENLSDRATDLAFEAPADVLPALARSIGVNDVLSCLAEFHLVPDGAAVDVTGTVRAKVLQTCVVSLDLFESLIEEPIDVRFVPEGEIPPAMPVADDGEEGSPGMADQPEPIVNGVLNLGALAQEFLALGVDPYPRKPDAVFEQPSSGDELPSPFAALARLRPPKSGD